MRKLRLAQDLIKLKSAMLSNSLVIATTSANLTQLRAYPRQSSPSTRMANKCSHRPCSIKLRILTLTVAKISKSLLISAQFYTS